MTRYRTIVADPPWHYEGYANGLGRGGWFAGRKEQAKVQTKPFPYPTMTIDEIRAVPVRELAERDCWLFLWTTNRYLPESFGIAKAWGFQYRQLIVWSKTSNVSPFGGSLTPNRSEYLLVCRRGSPGVAARWPSTVIEAPKPNDRHSRKPDVFLDLIETSSPEPRVELFARRQRLGWDTWGNEALGHVEVGGSA